ncbi:HAD-IIA family hydrolase [Butyrivibrio sp. VCD2006]|uniref:HAD-IIA family hydrolase n=1 Tax=Butyrivibrio sp. VCD2006 TaxID=1280664 RepID=UPI0003F8F67A|nr:HAD-IIA family hydrolase [Butyrivibrio sp. VCD2006]
MNFELSYEKDFGKLKECKLFLLDMDGTLYLGDEVFDGAVDFINTLSELGKRYIYLTNNSSRSGMDYVERLRRLGFSCEKENVYTSGMATAEYLKKNYGERYIYVVGTKTFYNELKIAGLKVFNAGDYDGAEVAGIDNTDMLDEAENLPVVCVGFDTELVYRDLDLAVHFLRKDSPFIAANPDWVCPMPAGEVLPDCGSICALLTASTGKEPVYIGKPNRNMVDIISSMTGIPNENICCVGDRTYTDIAVAQNAGAASVCVLSGECDEIEIAEMDRLPDYTMSNVAELAEILKGL